jgi:hypothetical protein
MFFDCLLFVSCQRDDRRSQGGRPGEQQIGRRRVKADFGPLGDQRKVASVRQAGDLVQVRALIQIHRVVPTLAIASHHRLKDRVVSCTQLHPPTVFRSGATPSGMRICDRGRGVLTLDCLGMDSAADDGDGDFETAREGRDRTQSDRDALVSSDHHRPAPISCAFDGSVMNQDTPESSHMFRLLPSPAASHCDIRGPAEKAVSDVEMRFHTS